MRVLYSQLGAESAEIPTSGSAWLSYAYIIPRIIQLGPAIVAITSYQPSSESSKEKCSVSLPVGKSEISEIAEITEITVILKSRTRF